MPRLSEKGAEELMALLVAKGFFKGADHDCVIVKTHAGQYATISHLCAQLTSSLEYPAALVDASDAAARIGISTDDSRRVLSSLRETDAVQVHQIKPSQSSCQYDADSPVIIISKATMDQSIREEAKSILESTEKAKTLGEVVDNLLHIPEHILSLSSLRMDAIDLVQSLTRSRFLLNTNHMFMQQKK